MATKKETLEQALRGAGCLGKAADNEPVFVLRAQDALAARLIEKWATLAEGAGCPPDKVAEARELAAKMYAWPGRKMPD